MSEQSEDHLTIAYVPATDDFYALATVSARAAGFAGRSSAWFTPEALAAFGAALAAYPLDPRNPPILTGGYGDNPQTGVGAEDSVRLEAQPIGSLGQVGIAVRLVDPSAAAGLSRPGVTLELLTSYEQLRRFAEEVVNLSKGTVSEARLGSDVLATT